MKNIKNYGISILIMVIGFILLSFLLTLLSYFDIIGDKTLSIFEIISMILIMLTGGFLIGLKSNKKGWLEGLKIGLIFYVFLSLVNIIFFHSFNFKTIIYYLILLIPSILGGMIGILKK